MRYKNRLTETNNMRKLMGLNLIVENEDAITEIENAQKMAEARALKEKELKAEGHYIDEDGDVIGTGDTGASDEAGAPESEKGLKKFDDDELFEDSEGEETYHYGEDEGEDEERIDHDDLSKSHIKALKKDMEYDEDHEDRREKGTDFWEQKTFNIKKNGKVISLKEEEIKKLATLLLEDDDRWMQKADADIERRGTEGTFHDFCRRHGFEDGCSEGCWRKADEVGGIWVRRAGLAKALCESKH